jgi:hypothetical protein
MAREPTPGTLGARLRSAHGSAFVGRQEEVSRFRAALERPDPAILWFFAPGGTGKSTLLRQLGEVARVQGTSCVELDLASVEATPAAILGEIEQPFARSERAVLMFDSYERGIAIDGWVRETLLPALPEQVIVVVASRNPPSVEWRADPAVGSLLESVELGPLDPVASRALLVNRGVGDRSEDVIGLARGHALTLVLLAEVLRSTGRRAPSSLHEVPEVVTELVAQLVREIESRKHRRALELCAHARRTTEDLLQAVIDPDSSHELLTWLRGLPYVSAHRDGVALHPIVRDAIDEDFRWRDPPGYRALHLDLARRLIDRLQGLIGSETDRERTFLDLLYLRRVSDSARRVFDFDTLGSGWAEVPRPDEREKVAALVEAQEGPTGGRSARYWFDHQREAFTVVRAADGDPVVVSLHLVLSEIPSEARRLDPAFEQIHRFMEARDASHGAARIVVTRFTGLSAPSDGRLRHYRPALVWLTTSHIAFAFTALSDGERWASALAEAGHRRAGEFTVDGRTAPIFVADFRSLRPSEWLIDLLARDLEGTAPRDEKPRDGEAGLDRKTLGTALRHALENFTRPDQLTESPLLRSRWVRRQAGETAPSPQLLRKLILEAVASMDENPQDAKLGRALQAAFLRPAPSREMAAERLDVPFSTFRRHVSKGLERLEEILWSLESGG